MQDVLEALKEGRITVEEARRRLARSGLRAVDAIAMLDGAREARTGLPEVVLAEGKAPDDLARIVQALVETRGEALVSRLDEAALEASGLGRIEGAHVDYDAVARFARVRALPLDDRDTPRRGRVAVVTAGTADLFVAREAMCILAAMRVHARLWADRGVAAPARLAPTLREVLDWGPDAVVVAAGREGTLATVVSALLPVPVVGLPVSSGYGHGGRGEAALSTMLQSCSPLAVVNIDAGVTAGLVAARIARGAHPPEQGGGPAAQGEPGALAAPHGQQR